LFDSLARRGYCGALAGIALPNPASVALHESVGFRLAGVFPAVGYKLGRWHDVAWYSRALVDPLPDAPVM
jgi:phosphinothricin acetyltransferase